jgi:hypothetical protein
MTGGGESDLHRCPEWESPTYIGFWWGRVRPTLVTSDWARVVQGLIHEEKGFQQIGVWRGRVRPILENGGGESDLYLETEWESPTYIGVWRGRVRHILVKSDWMNI